MRRRSSLVSKGPQWREKRTSCTASRNSSGRWVRLRGWFCERGAARARERRCAGGGTPKGQFCTSATVTHLKLLGKLFVWEQLPLDDPHVAALDLQPRLRRGIRGVRAGEAGASREK